MPAEGLMQKLVVAAALNLAISAVRAADFGVGTTPSYLANAYSWAGPYVGGDLGYSFGRITADPARPRGIEGGAHGGYDWQSGRFVIGGEAGLSASAARDTFAAWQFSNPWFGTVRARAGYAVSNLLFYGAAGLAVGDVRARAAGMSQDNTPVGWTAGGGVEAGIGPHWSARVEYLFIDLPDRPYLLTGTRSGFVGSILRFGVNYRF
jgi:outer membrane immunogenic protein